MAGYTQIAATAAPGHALEEIESIILDEIQRVVGDGPTDDEMERGRAQAESQFIFRLQTVGGFGGKSDQLNAYNVFMGDPSYFDRDLARYRAVTPGSISQAVARYLDPHARVTLSVVPRGRGDLAAPRSELVAVS
jgi:zinc protease